jgi:hypothetical protein
MKYRELNESPSLNWHEKMRLNNVLGAHWLLFNPKWSETRYLPQSAQCKTEPVSKHTGINERLAKKISKV